MKCRSILTVAMFLGSCVAYSTLGLSTVQAASGEHDKAIEARQAMFRLYSFNTGILSAMAKGIVDYDAELAAKSAANLQALTSLDQSALWPAGSDNANPENAENRALPKIWESFPAIMDKHNSLKASSAVLAEKAGGGLDALRSAMGGVGKSCKGCHKEFRAPRK